MSYTAIPGLQIHVCGTPALEAPTLAVYHWHGQCCGPLSHLKCGGPGGLKSTDMSMFSPKRSMAVRLGLAKRSSKAEDVALSYSWTFHWTICMCNFKILNVTIVCVCIIYTYNNNIHVRTYTMICYVYTHKIHTQIYIYILDYITTDR